MRICNERGYRAEKDIKARALVAAYCSVLIADPQSLLVIEDGTLDCALQVVCLANMYIARACAATSACAFAYVRLLPEWLQMHLFCLCRRSFWTLTWLSTSARGVAMQGPIGASYVSSLKTHICFLFKLSYL